MSTTKAFVLLSGGIDSTTCLALAVEQYGSENVHAFGIDYGQKHVRELDCAYAICKHMRDIPFRVLNLGEQPLSALTDKDNTIPGIPDATYDSMGEGMSPSYHYFRNGQFLSLATAHAVALLEEGEKGVLYWGAHAEDAENWAYADCTPEFIGSMSNAVFIGTYQKLRLCTPLMWMTKHAVITTGSKLSVPYHMTWSCYRGHTQHCGACPTCHARKEAFKLAKVLDPTEYAEYVA